MLKKSLLFLVIFVLLIQVLQANPRRRRKFDDANKDQDQIEMQMKREEMRERERDRVKARRKKIKIDENSDNNDDLEGFNMPPGAQNWNKHRAKDDGFIDPQNKKKTKEQIEREQKISEELREKNKKAEETRKDRQQRIKEKQEKHRLQQELRQKQAEANTENMSKSERDKLEEKVKQLEQQEMEELEIINKEQIELEKIDLETMKLEAELHRDDQQSWLADWEELMDDFEADEMLTFQVDRKQQESFLEDIKQPCNIRGAYFLGFDKNQPKIEFFIKDPEGNKINSRTDKQGIFSIDIKEGDPLGTYQFYFKNPNGQNVQVSFAIDVTNNDEFLQGSDIKTMDDYAQDISIKLQDYLKQTKFQTRKSMSELGYSKSVHNKQLGFTILETFAIILCTFFQVFYIKKMLDNRNIV